MKYRAVVSVIGEEGYTHEGAWSGDPSAKDNIIDSVQRAVVYDDGHVALLALALECNGEVVLIPSNRINWVRVESDADYVVFPDDPCPKEQDD